jgi:hypothetical protein
MDEDCFGAEIMVSMATAVVMTVTVTVFCLFVGVIRCSIVAMIMTMRKGFLPPFLFLWLDVVTVPKVLVGFLCTV